MVLFVVLIWKLAWPSHLTETSIFSAPLMLNKGSLVHMRIGCSYPSVSNTLILKFAMHAFRNGEGL